MSKYRYWTPEEDQVVRDKCGQVKPKEVAKIIKRTENAVKERAYKLGVSTATERLRHKGNNPVKQKDIDKAVVLYKEHGSVAAAAESDGVTIGRMGYLVSLARRYKLLPPSVRTPRNMSEIQKSVLYWVKSNPGKKTIDCIRYFRKEHHGYYTIENAHIFLRRKGLIVPEGVKWFSVNK